MRIRTIAVAIVLALSGCNGTEPAVAPSVTPSASPSPSPSAKVALGAGMCHGGLSLSDGHHGPFVLDVVECERGHEAEIVKVGRLTTPPGDEPIPEVFTDCDSAAGEYVGADRRDGRLGLAIIVPSAGEWSEGDREYRCAVFELSSTNGQYSRTRTGTLKDSLRGPRPLALTCVRITGTPDGKGWYAKYEDVIPVDCAEPHNGEYVGLWSGADVPHPGMAEISRQIMETCLTKAAKFVGQSKLQFGRRTDISVFRVGGSPERWAVGDRKAQCYLLGRYGANLTKSLRAAP